MKLYSLLGAKPRTGMWEGPYGHVCAEVVCEGVGTWVLKSFKYCYSCH